MYCQNCGNEIDEDMLYCAHCGVPLKPETQKEAVRRSKKRPLWLYVLIGVLVLTLLVVVPVYIKVFSKGAVERHEMERQLKLAENYLDKLNYRKAVAAYRAALEIDPENREALDALQDCCIAWAKSDPESAEEILEESLAWYEAQGLTREGRRLEKELKLIIEERIEAATFTETEPGPEEAEEEEPEEEAVKEADDGWKAAYLKLLNDTVAEVAEWNPDTFNYRPQGVLFYLDGDEIPEFAFMGMADGCSYMLYSYVDGETVLLDYSEGTRYIPGEGLYMDHQDYGVEDDEYIFRWDGRENRKLWEGHSEYDFDAPQQEGGHYQRKYYSEGKKVTEAQYNAAITRNFDDSRAVSLEYDKSYEEMVDLLSQ